jgi:hypothetical protein
MGPRNTPGTAVGSAASKSEGSDEAGRPNAKAVSLSLAGAAPVELSNPSLNGSDLVSGHSPPSKGKTIAVAPISA